jgi:hypothetical protein
MSIQSNVCLREILAFGNENIKLHFSFLEYLNHTFLSDSFLSTHIDFEFFMFLDGFGLGQKRQVLHSNGIVGVLFESEIGQRKVPSGVIFQHRIGSDSINYFMVMHLVADEIAVGHNVLFLTG